MNEKQLQALKDSETLLNEAYDNDMNQIEKLIDALNKSGKVSIEYCDGCDTFKIDGGCNETASGDYVCDECHSGAIDHVFDMLSERDDIQEAGEEKKQD